MDGGKMAIFNMTAGFVFGIYALLVGWICFVPRLTGGQDSVHRLMKVSLITAILVIGLSFLIPFELVFIIGLTVAIIIGSQQPEGSVLAYAVIYVMFAALVAFSLQQISVEMWGRQGSLPSYRGLSLAGIHLLATFLLLLVGIFLWRYARTKSIESFVPIWRCGCASTILFVIVFFQSMPRSGGDEAVLWLLIVPAAFLVAAFGLITCLFTPWMCRRKDRRRMNRGADKSSTGQVPFAK
jgi:hypothetical protein